MNNIRNSATIDCVREIGEINNVYQALSDLQKEYPGFEKWYFEKVVPGIFSGERMIFAAYYENKLAGIVILKDSFEKKICTLRVLPEYQRMGIGHQLLDYALSMVDTLKPVITVSDDHIHEFATILIRDYGFVLNELQFGYYRENHIEYVFNGSLA